MTIDGPDWARYDLHEPAAPDTEQQIAETLALMAARGYDFVGPGEAATVVRDVRVAKDDTAGAAYITLSAAPVEKTVAYSDTVNIDLGNAGQPVGIEVLYRAAEACACRTEPAPEARDALAYDELEALPVGSVRTDRNGTEREKGRYGLWFRTSDAGDPERVGITSYLMVPDAR